MPMTPCPACGAPLEYTGDGETVRCHFCGSEFQVTEVDGRPRFDVTGQPGPQKEVLQNQVAQIADPQSDVPPPDTPGGAARVYPGEPDAYQQAYQADLNSADAAAQTIHTGEASRWSGIETTGQVPPPPQPGQPTAADILRRPGTPGRWIAIAVAVILILCLACVCVAGLVFMAQRGGSFR